MIKKANHKKWVASIHVLFWLLLSTIIVLVFQAILEDWTVVITAATVNLCGFLILVYVHLLFLLPKYFDQEKYLQYIAGLLALIFVTGLLRFFIGWLLVVELKLGKEEIFTPSYFGSMLVSGTFFLMISIPLRLVGTFFKKIELEQELKTHQLEAELRFLKAQVNPHFLFNALNNIYALSFTKSSKAPEMILKLSDMMSYMLYDCKNDEVSLKDEVDYLQNYITLQQLKKDGELAIDFSISGNIQQVKIVPMLFIPFFENAFKHGNLEDLANGWMKCRLSLSGASLMFEISNSTVPHFKKKLPKGGIGLENIRQRLQLLFPACHQLKITHENNVFSVSLSLNLNGNEVPVPNR